MPVILTSLQLRNFNPQGRQWLRVTLLSGAHPWKREVFRKLAGLAELTENWDGYGSRSIQPAAVEQAAGLIEQLGRFSLPAPQLFPVPGGGLQLEWKNAKCGLELEILPDGTMEFLIEDVEGQMREGVVSSAYEELPRLILWFNGQKTNIVEC